MVAKKNTAPAYTPIGDVVSTGSAYVQAVTALDLAAEYAMEQKDAQILLQVADLYIAIGNNLNVSMPGGEDEDEDGEELESELFPPVGFGPATPREVAKNE